MMQVACRRSAAPYIALLQHPDLLRAGRPGGGQSCPPRSTSAAGGPGERATALSP